MRPWTFWLMAVLVVIAAGSLSLWLLVSLGYLAPHAPAAPAPGADHNPSSQSQNDSSGRGGVVSLEPEELQRLGIRVRKLDAARGQVEVVARGTLQEDLTRLVTLRAQRPGMLRAVESVRWPEVGDVLPAGSVIGRLEPGVETQPAAPPTSTAPDDTLPPGEVLSIRLAVGARVLDVAAQPGQTVDSHQIILRLVRHDQFLARVTLPEKVQPPDELKAARITLSGHESWPLLGRYLGSKESADKTQSLLFAVPAMGYPLQAGMIVAANIPVGNRSRAGVNLPEAAVFEFNGRSWVWVLRTANTFERRVANLGAATSQGWFVHDGLLPGETVVVQGTNSLLAMELKTRSEPDP